MNSVELLAPVGSKDAFYAAIENGADAVYLGGPSFNARMFADKFSYEDLAYLIDYAHLRGVKVFITTNILVYEEEMDAFIAMTDQLYLLHADAIIIQDLGVLSRIKGRYPGMEIHASTQMNTHSVKEALFLKSLGVDRIVVARETSIQTIKAIKEATNLSIEAFVHGALCVSYSGECLISSMIGSRSGNRGECAQTCRLPYTLMHDNKDLGKTGFLLSTKDLMTIDHLQTLMDNGVDSFKIEGRMKRPEYVAQTVKTYREAIDQLSMGKTYVLNEDTRKATYSLFNREFTKGYMLHEHKAQVLDSAMPNHRGTPLGTISKVGKDYIEIALEDEVAMHDGLRIQGKNETGVFLTYLAVNNQSVKSAKSNEIIKVKMEPKGISVGDKVVKTSDKSLLDALNETYAKAKRKTGIDAYFEVHNTDLSLTLSLGDRQVTYTMSDGAQVALSSGTQASRIIEQLHKTAEFPFYFKDVIIKGLDNHFIPLSKINEMRREALTLFESAFLNARPKRVIQPFISLPQIHQDIPASLTCFVHTLSQLEACIASGVDRVVIKPDEALLQKAKDAKIPFLVSMGRINERGVYLNEPLYAEELGAVESGRAFFASPYVNVTNSDALYLLHQQGLKIVGLSYELTKAQIQAIVSTYQKRYGNPSVAVMLYGVIDVMIMKSCPILPVIQSCAACKQTQYALRDRKDALYALYKEPDCTIRVLNHKIHVLLDAKEEFEAMGVKHFLMQFIEESYEETLAVIDAVKHQKRQVGFALSRPTTKGYYDQ